MTILTEKDIVNRDAGELSDLLIEGEFDIQPQLLTVQAVATLLDRLIGLLNRGGVRRRLEHLEQITRVQQIAINKLIERRCP